MQSATKLLIENAQKMLSGKKNVLKDNPSVVVFKERMEAINKTVATKNPLIKEYINLHREAEKYPNEIAPRTIKCKFCFKNK